MTYKNIDKRRFAQLLERGTDDYELRRFFLESKTQLILHGGRVQNLPSGKLTRIRILAQELPSGTDKIIQKWFSENLTMADPMPITEVIETLRMYEDAGESVPDAEARKLSRSCLIHLFSADPSQGLLEFLKPIRNTAPLQGADLTAENKGAPPEHAMRISSDFFKALISLTRGDDPDEYLSTLPSPLSSLVAGIHAARFGKKDEVEAALESLPDSPEVQFLLREYAASTATDDDVAHGLKIISVSKMDESATFDFDHDEVMAICTKDYPDTAVFVRPFAVRTTGGTWFSLSHDVCEKMFYTTGDVFVGRDRARQLKRGEVGLWRVAQNEHQKASHQTKFHVVSNKTAVYEVYDVPFASTDYDSVREYIKHQAEFLNSIHNRSVLFFLKDGLIVGQPVGKDLAKDEGFDAGLPCWKTLSAIRAEGRLLVPGPLPKSDTYECETLASSLRKLLTNGKPASVQLTKAQLKAILELVASGEARINLNRSQRLRAELRAIEEHDGAVAALLEATMAQPNISERVEKLVLEKADALLLEKKELQDGIGKLRKEKAALIEDKKKLESEQRTLAPATSKAIRYAFDKARREATETLGQVAVFKALIDEVMERPRSFSEKMTSINVARYRAPYDKQSTSVTEMLRALGVTSRYAESLRAVGQLAKTCGLILIIEGLAARLAAEGWVAGAQHQSMILECRIGLVDEDSVLCLLQEAPESVAILDANLSPLDVYARPLIDAVQRRIAGLDERTHDMQIVFSLSDGVAALPIPPVVESISLRVSLDRHPRFLSEAHSAQIMEDISVSAEPVEWMGRLWKPAAERVRTQLQSMSSADISLVLSVLDPTA